MTVYKYKGKHGEGRRKENQKGSYGPKLRRMEYNHDDVSYEYEKLNKDRYRKRKRETYMKIAEIFVLLMGYG